MFVDPEEAQVRVSMIIRVDENDVWSLRHSGDYHAAYSGNKYRFIFHKFIDCLNVLTLGDQASIAQLIATNSTPNPILMIVFIFII